jgi:mono/diheme cytochrome c family protein
MIKIEYKKYLNQIKENPGKIFGLVYIYILVIGFFFGIYYVNNISAVARQSVPPSLPDTVSAEDLKLVEARSIPPVDLSTVESPAQDVMEQGKNLYTTVCASCHGADGMGKGPAGAAINPPPKNFTSKENWKNGNTLSGIYKTLEEGIPGTAMIPYDYMPPQDKIALSHFVRNTFVPDPPKITTEEVTTLDQTYNLKGGSEAVCTDSCKKCS